MMKQILLIDNDAMFTGMVNYILAHEKYEVRIARDGKEARKALATSRYDLVIADMFIPYSNGFEMLHEIRVNKDNAETPVIMVSEVSNEKSVANCLRLGAGAYFTKPINPTQLVAEIKGMLVNQNNVAA